MTMNTWRTIGRDASSTCPTRTTRTCRGRRRAANDPLTAAYLRAAVWLIQRALGPDGRHDMADADDPDSLIRPLLGFLSQQAVTKAVRHNPPPFHQVGMSNS